MENQEEGSQKTSKKIRGLERFALATTAWAERWFPDSYIFAISAVLIVSLGALIIGATPKSIAKSFGDGYWSLIPFTMQMCMVVISGYVVATSPPVRKLIEKLALLPKTGRSAIAYVAFFSMLASLLNWALSLVFGGLYVRALARRSNLKMDYRAAGAAAYMGLGATWALGLSSSAAQLQANVHSIPESLLSVTGVIPYTETIFLPQSIAILIVLIAVSVFIAFVSAPKEERAKTAQDLKIDLDDDLKTLKSRSQKPSEWLEYSPALTIVMVLLGAWWLIQEFSSQDGILAISNLNTYNFLCLMLGMAFCWRPKLFLEAVDKSVPSVAGILIQFPVYGSIAYVLTKAMNVKGFSLSHYLSEFFVSISTQRTFDIFMSIYSAILGFFIPSGGGKWVIEAPYLMEAANKLEVHLGWTVVVYNASEALPNLINPFFMMALIGVLGLKAKDIVGYTITQLVVHVPLVILLLWLLGQTLEYHPPIVP